MAKHMNRKSHIVVLGAGFGGLELTTLLSEALGDTVDITLIDRSDSFVFGFSKLDVMFGHRTPESVRLPYISFAKPGVRLLKRKITAIDPEGRIVTTEDGVIQADFLVVALGPEYDFDATPGLSGSTEFYSVAGAERLRDLLHRVRRRPHRQGRGRFLLGPGADRELLRTLRRSARGQGAFRIEPSRALVRALTGRRVLSVRPHMTRSALGREGDLRTG